MGVALGFRRRTPRRVWSERAGEAPYIAPLTRRDKSPGDISSAGHFAFSGGFPMQLHGRTALIVIDVQKGETAPSMDGGIPIMAGGAERHERIRAIIAAARAA